MNALYSLYDALVSINVPTDKARAVVDAMERDMAAILATKSDVELLRQDVEGLRLAAKSDIELLRASMTIRLGSMLVVGLGILLGTLRWVIH
jgi:hypothetical protein